MINIPPYTDLYSPLSFFDESAVQEDLAKSVAKTQYLHEKKLGNSSERFIIEIKKSSDLERRDKLRETEERLLETQELVERDFQTQKLLTKQGLLTKNGEPITPVKNPEFGKQIQKLETLISNLKQSGSMFQMMVYPGEASRQYSKILPQVLKQIAPEIETVVADRAVCGVDSVGPVILTPQLRQSLLDADGKSMTVKCNGEMIQVQLVIHLS